MHMVRGSYPITFLVLSYLISLHNTLPIIKTNQMMTKMFCDAMDTVFVAKTLFRYK